MTIVGEWTPIGDELPPERVLVKVIGSKGTEGMLRRSGALYFVPDGSMYVYWVPEFWRHLTFADQALIQKEIDQAKRGVESQQKIVDRMERDIDTIGMRPIDFGGS